MYTYTCKKKNKVKLSKRFNSPKEQARTLIYIFHCSAIHIYILYTYMCIYILYTVYIYFGLSSFVYVFRSCSSFHLQIRSILRLSYTALSSLVPLTAFTLCHTSTQTVVELVWQQTAFADHKYHIYHIISRDSLGQIPDATKLGLV